MPFGPFSPTIGAAAFWLFLTIICVVGTLTPLFKARETQRTIRALAERGVIDPEILDRLGERKVSREDTVRGIQLGGLVATAAGIGIAALGFFVGLQKGSPVYPIYGAATLVTLVGLTLAIYGRVSLKALEREPRDTGR